MEKSKKQAYESEYHQRLHEYLYNNEEYYNARAELALIKYFKNFPKESKTLEWGCGLGQNIYLVKNSIGYDISKFAITFCKKKGINATNNLRKIKGNSFDIIISSHVLEHLENPFPVLKEIHRKLKKGGKLILILPVEARKFPGRIAEMEGSQHLYCWNFRTIDNLLIKAGFTPIENTYLYGTAYHFLLKISRISFKMYYLLTKIVAHLLNRKEMKIIAIKGD